jgi:hypothetical protein
MPRLTRKASIVSERDGHRLGRGDRTPAGDPRGVTISSAFLTVAQVTRPSYDPPDPDAAGETF